MSTRKASVQRSGPSGVGRRLPHLDVFVARDRCAGLVVQPSLLIRHEPDDARPSNIAPIARLLGALLLMTCSACSLFLVKSVPDPLSAPGQVVDCTSSSSTPTLDAGLGIVAGVAGSLLAALVTIWDLDRTKIVMVSVGAGLAAATPFIVSSVIGSNRVAECTQINGERPPARRQLSLLPMSGQRAESARGP